jgi:LmbE family N-acetylglucosaminyl deacetylase
VLAVFAHPDDAEFGSGGTIASWIASGAEVVYVCVTDGSAGSNEPGAVREEVARIREQELRDAAAYLGVSDVVMLGYVDGHLEVTLGLRRDLTRQVRRVRPDLVLAPDPSQLWARGRYINHRDHRVVGEAMLAVVNPDAPTRPQFPELLEAGFEPFEVPALWLATSDPGADVRLDITPFIDKKIEALRLHASQMQALPFEEMVRQAAREMAEGAGMEYAEGFRTFTLVEDD